MPSGEQVGQWTTYDRDGNVVKVTTMKPKPKSRRLPADKPEKTFGVFNQFFKLFGAISMRQEWMQAVRQHFRISALTLIIEDVEFIAPQEKEHRPWKPGWGPGSRGGVGAFRPVGHPAQRSSAGAVRSGATWPNVG